MPKTGSDLPLAMELDAASSDVHYLSDGRGKLMGFIQVLEIKDMRE